MGYVSTTDRDRAVMLERIGIRNADELFADIPGSMRLKNNLALPAAKTEIDMGRMLDGIERRNLQSLHFIGAGSYFHHIPAVVDALASRGEFYTAYTPYQPEVSQGTLTAIFEFQTMMCRLTGMDVSNASMYDGATALAEAVLMSVRTTGRKNIIVPDSLHPHYRQVLNTYSWAGDITIREITCAGGLVDAGMLSAVIDGDVSAVIVQRPNFFGCIDDTGPLSAAAHTAGAHCITVVNEPLSLALLKTPGSLGSDIVCGEARSFGNPPGFGGPALGFLAARDGFMRSMPGRLVGKSIDLEGRDAYVLTLQTREQHIRREKATSNICSNEGLCALRAVIYLACTGGVLNQLAVYNHKLAAYCRKRLMAKGFETVFDAPYFNEFVVRMKNSQLIHDRLREEGILLGVHCGAYNSCHEDHMLVCCTEMNAKEDIDRLIDMLEKVL